MNRLVSRSLEILGQATKEMGQDYTSNITSFINDAKDVKNSIVKSTTDASDTYAKLKSTNITKKISDWFYQEENAHDSSLGDEFDPGFKIDSNDDKKLDGEQSSSKLTLESMTNITEKQTGAMIKIGRRQTEQSIANTAEIVSVVNSRTSEMIASMNNINKSLIGISDRLDKLIKLQTVEMEESKYEEKSGIYDSNGNLSLKRIFDQAKQNASNNSFIQTASIFAQMLTNGGGPTDVAKFLMGFGTQKKLDILDGKSIDEIGKKFNETIGVAIQTSLDKLINSGPLKNLNLTNFEGDKDYSTISANNYTTKKALFDGMTRMSIVSVIPEYLSKINAALSGENWHVDHRGRLVQGAKQNKFNEVTRAAFASTGLTDTAHKGILSAAKRSFGDKTNSSDINIASQALTGSIVITLHAQGRTFSANELKGDMSQYIMGAVQTLCHIKNDPQYWANICQSIVIQLSSGMMDSSKFVQNVNSSLKNMMSSAISEAKSNKMSSIPSKITFDMFSEQFVKTMAPGGKSQINTPVTNAVTPTPVTDDASVKIRRDDTYYLDGKHTQGDFIRGIFGILNRGINVKVLSNKNPSWKFEDYDLGRQSTKQEILDNKFGNLLGAAMLSGGNDEKVLKNAVRNGIKDAINGFSDTGEETSGGGGSTGLGFLGSLFSHFGGGVLSNVGNKLFSGGIKNIPDNLNALFGEIKSTTNEIKELAKNNMPATLKYDKRAYAAADAVAGEGGLVDTAGEKGRGLLDSIKNKVSSTGVYNKIRNSGFVNDRIYAHESRVLSSSTSKLDNIYTDAIEDFEDRMSAESALMYYKRGDINNARIEANKINNKSLKKLMDSKLKSIEDITKKRLDGTALASGENPDVGSVLDQAASVVVAEDKKKGGIISIVKKGFGVVGKILGKLAQLAERGLEDITFGLKNMAGGLFGNKLRDEYGEVLRDENGKAIRSHGLIENFTLDTAKLAYLAGKNVAKKVVAPAAKWVGENAKNLATAAYYSQTGQKILNTTYTGQYARDEKGNVVRDYMGNKQLTNTATIEDLLKKPGQTLAKSLNNIATDIKNSKLSMTIQNLAKSITDSKLAKKLKSIANSIKTKTKGDEGKPGILSKIKNSRFVSGAMKGFNEAKRAREKHNMEKERNSSFSNSAIGTIMDTLLCKHKGEKTAFDQLLDNITLLHDDMNKNHKEDMGIAEEAQQEAENEKKKQDAEEKKTTTGDTSTIDEGTAETGAEKKKKKGTTELSEEEATKRANVNKAASKKADRGDGGLLGSAKNLVGDIMGNFGQMMGGLTQAVFGIFELVTSIVMGLEGLQALKDMVMSILTEGLEPLNEIFYSVMDLIKPIVKTLKDMVTTIADTVVTIAKSIIDVIEPIIEVIHPMIQSLIDILNPILELITTLVDVIMIPIMLILETLKPIIEIMGYTMKIQAGVLSIGMASIIGILGIIIKGIGNVIKAIGKFSNWTINTIKKIFGMNTGPGKIEKAGQSIIDTGDGLIEKSSGMFKEGYNLIKEGFTGLVNVGKSLFSVDDDPDDVQDKPETSAPEAPQPTLGYDMGSGDVSNVYNSWTYTYGSGNTTMNQHSYGNYMNMSERGCGPVALADAYNRRNGGNINPRTLASDMMGAGMYEPRKGTSANSMISAGNAMGMNMRLGGVTQSSLKGASPTNPITVLGSGAGFGTKSGNNHYVNVIGTDKNGGAYVSNPMSGRVERQSASNLALNAKLGLYGAGDDDNEYAKYGFDDETANAFANLKKLTSQLTEMFQYDSREKEINEKIETEKNKTTSSLIKNRLGDEEYSKLEEQAMSQLKSENPQMSGESNEDYEKRINKLFKKKGSTLISKLGGSSYIDDLESAAKDATSSWDTITKEYDKTAGEMLALSSDFDDEMDSDNGNGFESSVGAIMAPYSPIEYMEPQIEGVTSGKSPVHDFFTKTSGDNVISAYTLNGGWFERTDAPVSKEGVGSQGTPHEGIAISFSKKSKDGGEPEAHAITGGTITYVGTGGKHGGKDTNGGLGNHVKWRDDAGMYHWYLHLADLDSKIKEGANLEPGQLIGHVGDTGDTGERGNDPQQLLRYIVTRMGPYGNTGDDGYVNPLTYWQFQEGGNEELTGGSEKEQVFNYLVNTLGLSKKAAAGIMGVFQAESGLSAGTLEGYYAFDTDTVNNAKKSNTNMDTYTTGSLFPMYANSGVGINKDAYKGSDGHYYPGFGLAQWTGPRGAKLMAYAKENGVDWTDLASQLGLIKQELNGDYSGLYNDLKSKGKDDVVRAANLWMTQYEAGGSGEDPNTTMLRSLGGISTRQNNAKAIYNEFANHTVSPSSATSSNNDGSIVGRFISSITNHAGTGDGFFISDGGAAMANYGTPKITSTNITANSSGNSPVHEFFGAMVNDMTATSANGNWYGMRQSPDSSGKGSSGSSHGGIDIWWGSGKTEGQELHAITGGVVDRSQGGATAKDGSNGGCGNNVRWLDDAGYLHWYMHMLKDPLVKEGDRIEPGQLLGYAGDTGSSDGAHLHYNINRADGFNGYSSDANTIQNPLTYFKNYNSAGASDSSNQGQHRGGFTNAKVQTTYTGYGPYKPENTDIIGPVRGSGDFWYDTLMDSQSNVTADIPNVDISKFDQSDFDTSNGNTQIVNNYEITSDSSDKMAVLEKMSKMTFNVRAERVEELLEELIEKVSGDKPEPSKPSTNGYDPNMFSNNRIPDQVTRLARG